MDQKGIFKLCKDLGCCDSCCLRYLGIRNTDAYENTKVFCLKFQDKKPTNNDLETPQPSTTSDKTITSESEVSTDNEIIIDDPKNTTEVEIDSTDVDMEVTNGSSNGECNVTSQNGKSDDDSNRTKMPPGKRRRLDICVSCLGLLQEDGWPECNSAVKEVLHKKQYDCKTFCCGLSSPIAAILREKVISLKIAEAFPDFDARIITSLKEAWKWAYGPQLARHLGLAADSGSVSPLLVVLHMEYPDDVQELEVLKCLTPDLFRSRSRQRKRFAVEFTRRSVEQALEGATLAALAPLRWGSVRGAASRASCVSVACSRAPLYLGGRYIKLSRELPQTPWLVGGKRMMESSVQEIIFEPVANAYGMSEAEAEHRLKFMSAGREDVDVRCLGEGRPFAIEITDPRRELTADELRQICDTVSSEGRVVVKILVPVTKEDLAILKSGEENKTKTYEALCVKLARSKDADGSQTATPAPITDEDIAKINAYRITEPSSAARVALAQRTPLRVLHRRALLTRSRLVLDLAAYRVPEHPQLVVVRLRTSAGAYVKEFVHGELRRTRPALGDALNAQMDILALDVTDVQLEWPNKSI